MKLLRSGPLLCCLSISTVVWGGDFEPPIAITNARIMPVSGEPWDPGTVIIEKGRIVAAGKDLTVPAGAMIVDAAHMYVYPGFIDCNSHLGMTRPEPDDDERAALEGERVDVRQGPPSLMFDAYRRLIHPHWQAEEIIDSSADQIKRRGEYRGLGFTAALISPKVVIFSGRSAAMQLGDDPVRKSLLKTDVAQHAAFVTRLSTPEPGPDRGEGGYPVTTMGAMAAFRQMMMDASWHRELISWSGRNPGLERPPVDHDLESLWPAMDGKTPVAFWANSENEIFRALDMAAEFKLKPMIVGGREAWKVKDRLKKENVPLVLSLKWSAEPKLPEAKKDAGEQKGDAFTPIFDDAWQKQRFEPQRLFDERKRLWAEQADNAQRLHEADIHFAIGSFEMKSSADLMKNLRKAIERGLPEDVAIAALTANAAELLGLGDQLGGIRPGMLANLTILDKPFKDEKSKVRWVFVDGKRFDIGEKSEWDKKVASLHSTDEPPKNGEDKNAASQPATKPSAEPASKPASQPTSQPAPDFAVETEADRKPSIQTGGDVLIKGVNILTVTKGDLENSDILVEKGVIKAIGKNLSAPAGVRVLDLPGYFAMPGVIDCHSHMCSDGGLNEASVSVACEVRVRDVVDHTDVDAFRATAGGVTMIHTMHGSANTIGGQNVVLQLKYGKPAAEMIFQPANRTVKFALGENVKQSNWGTRGTRFPNTRMGVEATMRRSFDAALEYKSEGEKFEQEKAAGKDPRPLRKDLRLEALKNIHDGLIWVHCHCYRADEILRLLAVAEDYGFRISVLQHVLEGYRIIPEIVRHGCAASTFSDWWAYKIEAYEAVPFNAARMEQGGVVATVNSDSAEVVRHLNLEAAKCMRFGGLSANDALRLCTLNGAISLGVQDKVGSLEVGKLADIAIYDGHPLDTFSKCVLTLIEGEVYFQHHDLNFASPAKPNAPKNFQPTRAPLQFAKTPGNEYWIVHGTAHPIVGPDIQDSLVILGHGEVFAVRPWGDEPPPATATLIDAKGLHVYPGLINAGTNMGLYEIGQVAATVDQNDIPDFQPDLMAMSAYNPFASAIDVTRCEGVTTTLVMPGGGFVSGRAGWAQLKGWSMPEVSRGNAAGFVVHLPSLPVEFSPDMPPDKVDEAKKEYAKNMAKIEEFFRQARLYADTHKPDGTPNSKPLAAWIKDDRRLEAMIPSMIGETPVFFGANSFKEIKEAIVFAERYKVRPIIVGGREAWKLAEELAAKKVDVILKGSMEQPASKFEPWDSVYTNAATLHKHGVRFCFGTGDATLAKQIGVEAGMAVAHGLPVDAAMRAVTIDAAKILGVDDRWGLLKAGTAADVIITTDCPLQASNTVVAEFIAGEPIELTSKHTRNDEMFLHRPKPELGAEPTLRGRPAIWVK
jgi:imidazolonepropionase-like amidohydrolase